MAMVGRGEQEEFQGQPSHVRVQGLAMRLRFKQRAFGRHKWVPLVKVPLSYHWSLISTQSVVQVVRTTWNLFLETSSPSSRHQDIILFLFPWGLLQQSENERERPVCLEHLHFFQGGCNLTLHGFVLSTGLLLLQLCGPQNRRVTGWVGDWPLSWRN